MLVNLDRRLDDWVAAGLLTREQADTLRAHERAGSTGSRVPLVAEALGYVGASLAVGAGVTIAGEYWDRFTPVAKQGLVGLLTVLLIGAGLALRDREHPAVQRLVSLLWGFGVAGTAWTVGLVAIDTVELTEARVGIAIGALVTPVAFVLWWLRPRGLQQVALAGGVVVLVFSSLASIDAAVSTFAVGLILYALALAWALLTWGGWLRPATTGYVLGFLGMGVGAQTMAIEDPQWFVGVLLGIVSAAALVIISVVAREVLPLVFGAIGIFVFVPQLVFRLFADTLGAPITLFVTGMLLIVAALGVARLRGEVVEDDEEEVHVGAA